MKNSLTIGRVFFAIAVIASGVLQLMRQDFVRLVPKLPSWVLSPALWATVSGGLLVCAGVALLVDKWRRFAVIVVGGLLLGVLLLYLPGVLANPSKGYVWTNLLKTLALLGGVFLLGREIENGETSKCCWLLGAVLLGTFLVVGGVQHFVYANFVEKLVPAWMPGRRSWVFVTGAALIAGGVGLVIPNTARTAALLMALMIFLWLLLHIPRALATWPEAGETAAIFEALATAGTALMLAGYRSKKSEP